MKYLFPIIFLLLATPAYASEVTVRFYFPTKVYENAEISAFTASKDETDDSPFITASGVDVRKVQDIVACPPELKFGSKLLIDGHFYSCQDRMATRYRNRPVFDVYVKTKKEAFAFGRKKNQRVVIFEERYGL